MTTHSFSHDVPGPYLRASFEPTDRLAVVLVNKRPDFVIQRIATADKIASQDFLAWLRFQDSQHFEIYVSMNALREGARGRTKEDVAVIRHVYLDFDDNGTAAVRDLFKRQDLPTPSHVLNTSPDKWQVTCEWRVLPKRKPRICKEPWRGKRGPILRPPIAHACSAYPDSTTISIRSRTWCESSRTPPQA
jgi:hypothetical protein